MLKRMEQAGLVSRTRSAADERQVAVALTPRGRALKADIAAMHRDLACLLPLEPREIGRLRGELRALADGLMAAGGE